MRKQSYDSLRSHQNPDPHMLPKSQRWGGLGGGGKVKMNHTLALKSTSWERNTYLLGPSKSYSGAELERETILFSCRERHPFWGMLPFSFQLAKLIDASLELSGSMLFFHLPHEGTCVQSEAKPKGEVMFRGASKASYTPEFSCCMRQ